MLGLRKKPMPDPLAEEPTPSAGPVTEPAVAAGQPEPVSPGDVLAEAPPAEKLSKSSRGKAGKTDGVQPPAKKSAPSSPEKGKEEGKTGPRLEVEEEESVVPNRPVLVELRDVSKRYGHHLVLDHVTLKFYKGEFLSLVGPSGAGKSTLIKCLTLQERPDEGRIIVAGRDITLLRRRELPYYRRKVGIVFQDFKLLGSKTVYENVAFALEVSNVPNREIRQRVNLILETVGMFSKRDNFPHELSGGEQQRAAIARALVHDPKILIADEPTGNLDPVNTWEIIELLFKINKSGTMVILATHDREIVDTLKKRVVTMRAGKIVSDQEVGTYIM
jgi:cell division transport system ATP-binding protein